MDIATKFSIHRIKRCIQILGRKEGDRNPLSHLMYAAMQCADIFFLRADVCQLGMDQRKVNILAREYSKTLWEDKHPLVQRRNPPIIISHHMLAGLKQCPDPQPVDKDAEIEEIFEQLGLDRFKLNNEVVSETIDAELRKMIPDERVPEQVKMSKSDPDNAIFMDDTDADVRRKIKKAFCRPQLLEPNPILEYIQYIIMPLEGRFVVTKKEKHVKPGDPLVYEYTDYAEVEKQFESGFLHPDDIKKPVAEAINRFLQPVRDHFATDPEAKKILAQVKRWRKEAAKKKKK